MNVIKPGKIRPDGGKCFQRQGSGKCFRDRQKERCRVFGAWMVMVFCLAVQGSERFLLSRSQRKKGPPRMAVMMPTGTSAEDADGAGEGVAEGEEGGPKKEGCGNEEAMIRPDENPANMGCHDADKADRTADGDNTRHHQ